MKKTVMVVVLALGSLFVPASAASACEPGDPNCNLGCEIINRIFPGSCNTR